jgi:hypothetical protein
MREISLHGHRAGQDGLAALVDDADLALVAAYRWYPQVRRDGKVYVLRHILTPEKHATQFIHNLIMGLLWVDHADGNPLNNQRSNLRIATPGQNAWNACKRRDARTSTHKGVHWRARSNKWVAQIQHAGQKRHLGYFLTEEAAARAYDTAARELFGEFARLNFPKGE